MLSAAGLAASESGVFDNTVPKGQVVRTNPAAGASADSGSTVTVQVSKGPDLVTVPTVSSLSVLDATHRIEAAGLHVSEVVGSPDRPVSATTPPPGAQVLRGSAVRLTTS
jgi:serine/threonine-protein kinase